ncbi:MAG: hypothetical protein K2L87_05735 [Clostridiales bacterium]|nr:hypothetical protein [Clostridiales bacterium]
MYIAKKTLSFLFTALILIAFAVFLSEPARYSESVLKGISLWAVSVLPATFPLLFLTALITSRRAFTKLSGKISPLTQKLFRVSGAGGSVAVLAALSGYPVGARTLLDLYEKSPYDKSEAFRLACLASTSGPSFLVGVVGSMMFESAKAGWIMLFSHLFAIYIVCFVLRFTAHSRPIAGGVLPVRQDGTLFDKIWSSVVSVLCVGGLIALFYCFADMLANLGLFSFTSVFGENALYAEGVLRGLMEMTTGCAALSEVKTPLAVALACFLVTFGGLCVIMQQLSFLSRTGVRSAPFIAVKFLQGLLAGAICFLLMTLFGI